MFLVKGHTKELQLIYFTNKSLQTSRDESCSQSRWVLLINTGAITWKIYKHKTVIDSTWTYEYI